MDIKEYQVEVQFEINVISRLEGKKPFRVASSQAALSFVWEQFEDGARVEDTAEVLLQAYVLGALAQN